MMGQYDAAACPSPFTHNDKTDLDSTLSNLLTMVKKGRFTVELVNADTKTAFKEHTKDTEIYVEAEPDAEYFVRIVFGAGSPVRARIFIDDKFIGYNKNITKPGEETVDCGLWSFDGVSGTDKALLFAKAKVFNSSNAAQEAPFWTGNVKVEFSELLDTGRTHVVRPSQNKWKGGDVGVVEGQAGPKMKGVMTKEGNIATSQKDRGLRRTYIKGRILETITLKYCSTVGLMMAGVLGPVDPCVMAKTLHDDKRGADAVTVDAASMPLPKKIRFVQEVNGQSFGPPKEYDLFDLTNYDTDDDNERRGRPVSVTPS
jgi:hypothetical protein